MQFMFLLAISSVIGLAVSLHATKSISSTQPFDQEIQDKINVRSIRLLRRGGQCYSKPLSRLSHKTNDNPSSSSRCDNTVTTAGLSASISEQSTKTKNTNLESGSVRGYKKSSELTRLVPLPRQSKKAAAKELNPYERNYERAETRVRETRAHYSKMRQENCALRNACANQAGAGVEEHKLQLSQMAVVNHSQKIVKAKNDQLEALVQAKEAAKFAKKPHRVERNGIKVQAAKANLEMLKTEQGLSEARMNKWLAKAEHEHLFLSEGRDHPKTRTAQEQYTNAARKVNEKKAQTARLSVEVMKANNKKGSDTDSSGSSSDEEILRTQRHFTWM